MGWQHYSLRAAVLSAALSWVLSPVKHLRKSSWSGLKVWCSYKHDFQFLSCAAGISQLFPNACFLFSWLLLISHSCCVFPLHEVPPLTTCSSSEALGCWPGFYYCSYELLTLLFQKCMKEADLEAFTCTALLSLVSPHNTLFSTYLVCVERGFYSLLIPLVLVTILSRVFHPPTPHCAQMPVS